MFGKSDNSHRQDKDLGENKGKVKYEICINRVGYALVSIGTIFSLSLISVFLFWANIAILILTSLATFAIAKSGGLYYERDFQKKSFLGLVGTLVIVLVIFVFINLGIVYYVNLPIVSPVLNRSLGPLLILVGLFFIYESSKILNYSKFIETCQQYEKLQDLKSYYRAICDKEETALLKKQIVVPADYKLDTVNEIIDRLTSSVEQSEENSVEYDDAPTLTEIKVPKFLSDEEGEQYPDGCEVAPASSCIPKEEVEDHIYRGPVEETGQDDEPLACEVAHRKSGSQSFKDLRNMKFEGNNEPESGLQGDGEMTDDRKECD
jgi:hypothetical protein